MLSVLKLQTTKFDEKFYTKEVQVVFEDHLQLILDSSPLVQEIDSVRKIKWQGDFTGMLHEMGISGNIHWLVMRINGLTSGHDDFSGFDRILIPTELVLESIMNRYLVRKK